ncbi:hypothetical protein [Paraburkholderia pallida]|uniref:Uncharacterized protein n=1 Tax=Paraburkholderia pallida TaxID=2547399 RepID=A0A4P7CXS6_9BURK|nr:hypothetical protein [Paraburkholderia pallida]QBQ99109.1 hypothetical protein E1956_17970 [Paraburkholderia pallida]
MVDSSHSVLQAKTTRIYRLGTFCLVLGWFCLASILIACLIPVFASSSWGDDFAAEVNGWLRYPLVASLVLSIPAGLMRGKRAGLLLFVAGFALGVWGLLLDWATAMAGHGSPY